MLRAVGMLDGFGKLQKLSDANFPIPVWQGCGEKEFEMLFSDPTNI